MANNVVETAIDIVCGHFSHAFSKYVAFPRRKVKLMTQTNTTNMGLPLRYVGLIHLFFLILCTPINPLFDSFTKDHCLPYFSNFYSNNIKPNPTNYPAYIYQWYLSGIILNALTLVYAIALCFLKKPITTYDLFGVVAFTLLFGLHFLVPFILYARINLILLPFSVTILYVINDIIGIRESKRSDRGALESFLFPFWCLDLPSLAVITLILIISHGNTADTLFYEGMSASLLVFQTCIYVAIMTIIVPYSIRQRTLRIDAINTKTGVNPNETT
jgi:hypothetical protein